MEKNTKVILVFFVAIAVLVAIMYFSVIKSSGNRNENAVVNISNGFFDARGNGSIEIIEFSDFQCPVCGQQEPVLQKILNEYGDKVKLFYKNFPLSMHKNSFNAALASMCANEQDKFWEYHDVLFENQIALDKTSLRRYAQQINLDMEQFNSCLDSEKYKKEIEKDINEGKKAGVEGTPTFFINNKLYRGLWDFQFFKEIIGN